MKKIMSIFFVLMLCISLFGCSHEHNMEKTIISEASCVLKGSVKHYCTKCDYSYIEETKAKGHVYDDGCIDKEATCDTAGHKVFVCAVCGAKKEESISPSHSFSEEVTLEATCYNNGKKVLTCSVCGYQETEEMMPLQRACGAESQVRNKLSNGPLRAQSNGVSQSILRRCRQAYKCRGYAGILLSARGEPVNQGGTADNIYFIRP